MEMPFTADLLSTLEVGQSLFLETRFLCNSLAETVCFPSARVHSVFSQPSINNMPGLPLSH